MAWYVARVSTDVAGDGTNLSASGSPIWNGIFDGLLMAVRFDFSASAAATADTTLTEIAGFGRTLGNIANSNTDITIYPQAQVTDNTGVGVGAYTPYVVNSANLKVTIAQGGTSITDAVLVYVNII